LRRHADFCLVVSGGGGGRVGDPIDRQDQGAPLDEWPHLIVPGVDGPDMNKLEKLARPKRPKGSSRIGGVLLDRGKATDEPFTAVSQLTPEFAAALAGLDEKAVAELGKSWFESIDGAAEEDAVGLVRQMREFSQSAASAGLPVLELVRM